MSVEKGVCAHMNAGAREARAVREIPLEVELQVVVNQLTWAMGTKLKSYRPVCIHYG